MQLINTLYIPALPSFIINIIILHIVHIINLSLVPLTQLLYHSNHPTPSHPAWKRIYSTQNVQHEIL
jgi:hypothetical protein